AVEYLLDSCDLVLVMTVNPGFGGQKFIRGAAEKISVIRKMLDGRGIHDVEIEVDGGVNVETAAICRANGADVLVAGNAVFSSDDPKKTIELLRG
nr:ribulose-phosphate 3-epimerase [Eubacteriales bacterium]